MTIWCLRFMVRPVTDLLEIHSNSVALFYKKLRLLTNYHLLLGTQTVFDGEIELYESYFCGIRKGKLGRGESGKVAVFGLLKSGGQVYIKVVDDI